MHNHARVDDKNDDLALERSLVMLGQRVAFPPTPDIASHVLTTLQFESMDELASGRQVQHQSPELAVPVWEKMLAAACLALVVFASIALTAIAIAQSLGILGVRVTWLEHPFPSPPAAVGATLALGRQVSIEEAAGAVDFVPLAPTSAILPSSPAIYLSGSGPDAMVSFAYPASDDLPAVDDSGVGALITQFAGQTERPLIEKGLVAPNGTEVSPNRLEAVTVHGEPGYWISGVPHAVFFVCSGVGECRQEPYRLSGDVLLWVQDGLTLRLESGLSKDQALEIAETVRSISEAA